MNPVHVHSCLVRARELRRDLEALNNDIGRMQGGDKANAYALVAEEAYDHTADADAELVDLVSLFEKLLSWVQP